MSAFVDETAALCGTAAASLPPGALAERASALGARLGGPLRVAIAGRVKAGKSTLLNALIGQRVAATDAGECTRLVTWYEHGPGYGAQAVLLDGSLRPVPFQRDETNLRLDLAGFSVEAIDRLHVTVPSPTLERLTLIDTPGLASIDGERSRRTERFLDPEEPGTSPVDAVLYLMRHVHQRDVAFLDAFMDRSVAGTSPMNAIAVLSRADEVGAGRLDAMEAAERVAARYRANQEVRSLCSAVVPVAGLLAETAATLREDEVGYLRRLAELPPDELDDLLVTADRFLDTSRSPLTVEVRRALLARFGVFGARHTLDLLVRGEVANATDVAAALEACSGVGALEGLLAERFLPRARVLQARAVLVGLRALAARCRDVSPAHADWLAGGVERVEATSRELAQLRLLHLTLSGTARLRDDEAEEVRRVVLEQGLARLELDGATDADAVRAAALVAIGRWRVRADEPLVDPATREAAELVAQAYEAIYAGG